MVVESSKVSADRSHFVHRALLGALTALTIAVFCLAGCGKGGGGDAGGIAGKEPIKKIVKVESNVDALRAWSMNGAKASVLVHIDPVDAMTVFPNTVMDDMKTTALELRKHKVTGLEKHAAMLERGGTVDLGFMAGMFKRVIWVVPTNKHVGAVSADDYRNYLVAKRGFPVNSVQDLFADGKVITGAIAGVPLVITSLADLALGPGENAIIDINLNYFPALKLEDSSYRTGTKTLLQFLRDLEARNVKANLVTVNLSTQNNTVPMDLRYYGGVISEALANPAGLNGPMPAKWQSMIQAEDSIGAKHYAGAVAIYSELTKTVKDDAGLFFSLAIAEGFRDKGEECRAALLEAYRLDGEYLKGFFQLARVLADAGKLNAGINILDTPDLTKIMAKPEIDYQRGLFYYTAHKPFDAATYLGNVAQYRPNDFGLFTILFRAHREAGNNQGQIFALQKLVSIDDGRVKREMPWVYADLGDLYAKANIYGNAKDMYEKYMKVFPDDSISAKIKARLDSWKAKGLIAK
jgi:hypothetical protein